MAHGPKLRALIDRAAARHGGWDRWHTLGAITLRVDHLGGMIPWIKGLGRTFTTPGLVTVHPRARRAVFHDLTDSAHDVVFDRGRVAQVARDQTPHFDHDDYRRRFDGLAKHRRWSPCDAAYFFGYALTHYLALPFSLADADVQAHDHAFGRALPDRLTVRYPAGSHTHGRRERFHFSPQGLLVRHDYHAEILGPGTHGAHLSLDYAQVDGLCVARQRRVYVDLMGWATPVPVLSADLDIRSVGVAPPAGQTQPS